MICIGECRYRLDDLIDKSLKLGVLDLSLLAGRDLFPIECLTFNLNVFCCCQKIPEGIGIVENIFKDLSSDITRGTSLFSRRFFRRQLGLDLFNGRQATFELLGKFYEVRKLGDAHRGCRAAKRVFDNDLGF